MKSRSYAGRRRQRLAAVISLLALLLVAWFVPVPAQEAPFTEAGVKAAYLYHFGTYVNWPDPAAPDDVLTIAVLGDAEVFEQLERYLPGRTIGGRMVAARLVDSLDNLDDEEILYIGPTENRALDALLDSLGQAAQGRLIVTDAPDGIRLGASINFRLLDNRVRFEIDRGTAARAGLSLSSRLLAAADRVIDAP